MKEGDKIYCYKNYCGSDREIINHAGETYKIISITYFNGTLTDIVAGVTTDKGTKNVFWLKYQEFEDNWNDMRQRNLLSSYFLTEKEHRKLKLEKINECTK